MSQPHPRHEFQSKVRCFPARINDSKLQFSIGGWTNRIPNPAGEECADNGGLLGQEVRTVHCCQRLFVNKCNDSITYYKNEDSILNVISIEKKGRKNNMCL